MLQMYLFKLGMDFIYAKQCGHNALGMEGFVPTLEKNVRVFNRRAKSINRLGRMGRGRSGVV